MTIDIKAILRYSAVLLVGGLLYTSIELIFRHSSHWTMTLTGGVSFLFLYVLAVRSTAPLWKKALIGAAVITILEFAVGIVVNKILCWNIWDYSAWPFNIMGQICPAFSAVWILLSAVGIVLSEKIYKLQCRAEKKFFSADDRSEAV